MTTIAFDGRTLATDKASWKGEAVWSVTTKLLIIPSIHEDVSSRWRIPTHSQLVWAVAGYASVIPLVLNWCEVGGPHPTELERDKNRSCGLILSQTTGRIYGLTSLCTLEIFDKAPIADGAGFEMALGAMLAGADAVTAIKIVTSRTGWAAGGVDSFTLPDGISAYGTKT